MLFIPRIMSPSSPQEYELMTNLNIFLLNATLQMYAIFSL